MSIFPHAWVNPGGHVDPTEELDFAAMRELFEETGIVMHKESNDKGEVVYIQNSLPCHFEPFLIYESAGASKQEDVPMPK